MVICISGMYRSGAPTVARLLNFCGLHGGADPNPAAADGPLTGVHGNDGFAQINEEILHTLGGRWDDLPRMEPGWENEPRLEPLKDRARGLIRQHASERAWGWSDPRVSVTLPFWLGLLPDLKVIACLRNPLEVVRALMPAGLAAESAYRLWEAHNRSLLAEAPAGSWLITHYSSYHIDPCAETQRLLAFIGLEADDDMIRSAVDAVLPSLRGDEEPPEETAPADVPEETAALYADLSMQAGPVFLGALDPDLQHRASGANRPLEERRLLVRLIEKEHQLQEAAGLNAELSERVDDLRSHNEQLTIRVQEVISRNEQLSARVYDLKSHNELLFARVHELTTRTRELTTRLHDMQDSLLFRLSSKYSAALDKLIPRDSPLRRFPTLAIKSLIVLFLEGPRGLGFRIKQRREFLEAQKLGPIAGFAPGNGLALSFNRNKVVFVGHDAFRAGAQMVLLRLLHWFKLHTNLDIHILLLGGGTLLREYSAIGPTLVLKDVSPGQQEANIARIKEWCGEDVKLVYGNTSVISKHSALVKALGAPIILHVHELQNIITQLVGAEVFRKSGGYVSRYIAVSPPVRDNMRDSYAIDEQRIELVYPFIDLQAVVPEDRRAERERLGLKETGKIVFGCGTTDHRKGVDIFVNTARRLREKGWEDFHFYWIGPWMPGAYGLTEELSRNHLSKYVTFLGEKDNPRAYFAVGDAFLLPSREDPFPLVCLEAAECGLPVVCFDQAGGIPAFVEEDAGFVVPYLDEAALADRLAALLSDDELRARMGARAREKVRERHTVDAAAPQILSIMQEVSRTAPTVSIIVPCYNHADYLPKRLDSIFNQTFRDFEVILLDDASTDATADILRQYEHLPNVSVEINTQNGGSTFFQWIKGIRKAKGQIIWIAEDDDYCEYDLLEKLLPQFEDPEVRLAYCQSQAVNEANEVQYSYLNHTNEFSPTRWKSAYAVSADQEVNAGLAVTNTIPNASAVLFRPFDVDEWSQLANSMRLAGDWLFYLFAIREGKIAFRPDHLNYHRRHQNTNIHRTRFSDQRFSEIVKTQRFIASRFDLTQQTRRKMKEYTRRVWESIHPDDKTGFDAEYNRIFEAPAS